jgi:hypothetical protein
MAALGSKAWRNGGVSWLAQQWPLALKKRNGVAIWHPCGVSWRSVAENESVSMAA